MMEPIRRTNKKWKPHRRDYLWECECPFCKKIVLLTKHNAEVTKGCQECYNERRPFNCQRGQIKKDYSQTTVNNVEVIKQTGMVIGGNVIYIAVCLLCETVFECTQASLKRGRESCGCAQPRATFRRHRREFLNKVLNGGST
jgi:hypothetical protein